MAQKITVAREPVQVLLKIRDKLLPVLLSPKLSTIQGKLRLWQIGLSDPKNRRVKYIKDVNLAFPQVVAALKAGV